MNYQYLHYDFFTTCRRRKINKTPLLLLIYLRGLYSRFGNIFTWKNKTIIDDLGIDRRTLQRSRLLLREKGIIDFASGKGHTSTECLILDTVLAPERPVRGGKMPPRNIRVMKRIKKKSISPALTACLPKIKPS